MPFRWHERHPSICPQGHSSAHTHTLETTPSLAWVPPNRCPAQSKAVWRGQSTRPLQSRWLAAGGGRRFGKAVGWVHVQESPVTAPPPCGTAQRRIASAPRGPQGNLDLKPRKKKVRVGAGSGVFGKAPPGGSWPDSGVGAPLASTPLLRCGKTSKAETSAFCPEGRRLVCGRALVRPFSKRHLFLKLSRHSGHF